MLDGALTHENVIAVSFAEDANAYEALSRLKELDAKVVTKDQIGDESVEGTVGGGRVGLLVGVLGGPLGVLVGGATGVLVGSLFDEDDDDDTRSVLGEISSGIRVGP